MKKIILTLLAVLLGVFVLFSLLSLKGDYRPERALWKINKQLYYIATHNESTTDYQVNQLVEKYRAFIRRYQGTVHAQHAELVLGDLYSLRKDYNKARQEYHRAIGKDAETSAKAEFTTAQTYELQGHREFALPLYKSIIQKYPKTTSGFITPIYLTKHLTVDNEYTQKAYAEALSFYRQMAKENPGTRLEFNALRLMALCEIKQEAWPQAVKTMETIILKYPTATALQEAINSINIICVTKLHDYDLGIRVYQQFMHKFPEHPVNPALKRMIADLQKLKSRNVVIKAPVAASAKQP